MLHAQSSKQQCRLERRQTGDGAVLESPRMVRRAGADKRRTRCQQTKQLDQREGMVMGGEEDGGRKEGKRDIAAMGTIQRDEMGGERNKAVAGGGRDRRRVKVPLRGRQRCRGTSAGRQL